MFAQPVPDLELAKKIIADKRPRSVGRAKKLLAMNGFRFDCEGFFLAGEPRGCHMYEIGPDPLSETGFSIERKD